MAGGEEGPGLEQTPTYSVAITACVFILVSLLVERGIHRLKKYLKRRGQKPLRKVLDKMTEELMLLGFISLLLTVLQSSLIKICVTEKFANHMLPCTSTYYKSEAYAPAVSVVSNVGRKLLYYFGAENSRIGPKRQLLAEEETSTGHCGAKGKVPFVSLEVLHQLHIFIFVLAITHVFYSLVTVCLGFARLHNWQLWERETRCDGYDGNLDLEKRFCKFHEDADKKHPGEHTSAFVDKYASHMCYANPIMIWIICFFQQFYSSVSREDYLVFRVGFLNKHKLADTFNFRDYVIRSMEVDFRKVIGISWWLWLVVVLFLLLNVHHWYTYFWMAFIPTIIVLVIGTKQQHIISTLALQAKTHARNILTARGDPTILSKSRRVIDMATAVSPSDTLFWFDNPRILLKLLHFVIFQNSFELAVFFWLLTTFGWRSCIMGNHTLLIVRLVTGILTQLLASYSTLPIYALVTQMGSQMKETVFTEEVFAGLQGWKAKAQKNRGKRNSNSSSGDSSQSNRKEVTPGASVAPEASGTMESSIELSTLPERTADSCQADPNFARMCQLMYGKSGGLEKIKAAQVNPR